MSANDRQIGGSHYRTQEGYQHWDWVEDCGLGYLEGCATKYIVRYGRKESGLEGLRKADHYLEKLEALARNGMRRQRPSNVADRAHLTNRMLLGYPGLHEDLCRAVRMMAYWDSIADIMYTRQHLSDVIHHRERQQPLPDLTGQEHPFGFDEKQDI